MRKIILTFFAFIFIAYPIYAFGECSIENGPPEELKNYVQNINIIANNINSIGQKQAKKKNLKLSDIEAMKKMQILGNEVLRGINISYEGWREYEFDFKNLVEVLKEKERPIPVNRDLKFIDLQIEKIAKYISNSTKLLYGDEKIEAKDICTGISNSNSKFNCNFTIANNVNVLLINIKSDLEKVRSLILNNGNGEGAKFIFDSGDTLKNSIRTNYGKVNIENCTKDIKGSFGEEVLKDISGISLNYKSAENGAQKWKDAWALLIGTKIDYGLERKLLINELKKQGVSDNGIQNMVSNLDKYNYNGGITTNDNYFTNTFTNITNSVKRQINSFNESLEQYFIKENVQSESVLNILNSKNQISDNNDIKNKIDIMYKVNSSLIQSEDLNTENIITRLSKMHTNIARSITPLEKTIPISKVVCDSQCKGKGKCAGY